MDKLILLWHKLPKIIELRDSAGKCKRYVVKKCRDRMGIGLNAMPEALPIREAARSESDRR